MNAFKLIFLMLWLATMRPLFATAVLNGKPVKQLPMHASGKLGLAKISGASANASHHFWPHPTGQIPLLALLVDFSDEPAHFGLADVDSFLNAPGYYQFGNNGSIHDYFSDVSNGKVDLHYTVKGYYRAKHPKSYYESESDFGGGMDLAEEVLKAFDDSVDYRKFDADSDGVVNAIQIFYAGAQNQGGLWGMTTESQTQMDGTDIGRVSVVALGEVGMSLGVACHEAGHLLFNWPDLYNHLPYGLGGQSLMADFNDPLNPIPPDEVLKSDQGWIDIYDLTTHNPGTYQDSVNGRVVYRFQNPLHPDEAFFIANRNSQGRYFSLGRGRGLLIFHFDMKWDGVIDSTTFSYDTTKQSVMLVEDNGKLPPLLKWTAPAWYFYDGNQNEFCEASHGNANRWHDNTVSNLYIHDISEGSYIMSFKLGESVTGLTEKKAMKLQAGLEKREGYDAKGARSKQWSHLATHRIGEMK